jgi:hypothetical protein
VLKGHSIFQPPVAKKPVPLDGVSDEETDIEEKNPNNMLVPLNSTMYKPRQYISTEDHIKGWKKQKERTAGGMSGLHFGQYKAHLESPLRLLAAFDAFLQSVAYTTGYSFHRWRKGLDVHLLKKLQCYLASNLRTFLFIEPDHNMNNKILGSDAMRAGSRIGAQARDNYGGHKGLRAAETAMNQILTVNSIWGRGRAVIMSNDAKACYDRIAHMVVNLALRRLGIPTPALQSMLTTIQEMEHHVVECVSF